MRKESDLACLCLGLELGQGSFFTLFPSGPGFGSLALRESGLLILSFFAFRVYL